MRHRHFSVFVVGAFLTAIAFADDSLDQLIKKDCKLFEGTWRVVGLEINGNKSTEEDLKKLSVVNGSDGTWSLRSEDKEMTKGTSAVDPSKKPKTIDITPSEGEGKGLLHLGIYEISENSRKLCLVAPGKERPTEFSSKPGSEHILVTFERQKKAK